MGHAPRAHLTVVLTVATLLVALAIPARAQIVEPLTSTTTTEPSGEDPGEAPRQEDPAAAPPEAGEDPSDGAGEGTSTAPTGREIPPEAREIMNSVRRTPSNSSAELYAAVQELVRLGLPEDEAIRVGFGRFPVAGVANYSHDWLYPRWGPGFRFHLGTDVFADRGTPLRAPVDGIVTSGHGTLGGLWVKVTMADRTEFYFAHLSALPEGFVDGAPVTTGDIVGYVGTSGNARGTPPHLHLGIYPRGGGAVDPKPVLDQMLDDALAVLPSIVEQVRANRTASQPPVSFPRASRSALVAELVRPVLAERAVAGSAVAVAFETIGNPFSGGLATASEQARELAASIDWDRQAERARARRLVARRLEEIVRIALGPLVPAAVAGGETAAN